MNDVNIAELTARTTARLDALCLSYPDRSVGSPGGLAATEFVAAEFERLGLPVERLGFDCVIWEPVSASLTADGEAFLVHPGPYSQSVSADAPLVVASTVEELAAARISGAVVLLHGPIAASQIGPKNYPFYRMEEHMRIIELLETGSPAAVIAATTKNRTSAGSLDPFPLFEDGDFAVPSAYMSATEGRRLLDHGGERVQIEIDSATRPGRAEQLVARLDGTGDGRIVICAHVDSRKGTPGALDNATGVAVLLAAAEFLADSGQFRSIDFVPFNGEDDFAAYGEVAYLSAHGADLSDVCLAINIDAAGLAGGIGALSTYGCSERLIATIDRAVSADAEMESGPAWPMSDHMVFAMRGVPAVAITSSDFAHVNGEIAHGPDDLPDLADHGLVARTGRFVASLAVSV